MDVLADRRGIDVRVDDLRVGHKLADLPRHPVVEAGPHGDQQIAVVNRHVRRVRAVHAQHPERQRVRPRKRPQPHQGHRHRNVEKLGQRQQLLGAVRVDDPAAHVQDRALGPEHGFGRLLDLPLVPLVGGVVAADVDLVRIVKLGGGHADVLGNIHQDGAGPAARGQVKRFLDGRRKIRHVLHQEVVLGAGSADPDDVGLLKRVVAQQIGRHLPREHHDRTRIHVRVDQPRHRVGRAGTGGNEGHADLPRRARVGFRHMDRGLFVTDQNEVEVLVAVQDVRRFSARRRPADRTRS